MTRDQRIVRLGSLGLFALAVGGAVVRLALGTGFLLDDFYFLRRSDLGTSVWDYAPTRGDRPVGAVVLVVIFDVLALSARTAILVMAVGTGLVAVLFRALLGRLVHGWLPWAAAAGWVLLSTHSSLEAWPSTAPILVALGALGGTLLLASTDRPSAWSVACAAALSAAATLTYESSGIYAVILALAVRLRIVRRPEIRFVGPVALAVGGALAWSASRWPEARSATGQVQDLTQVVPANFGWGMAPPGPLASIAMVLALLAAAACLWDRRDHPLRSPDSWSVSVGAGLLALGTAPYALYLYEPFGVGDRFNYLSSFGGALVWTGLAWWVVARAGHVGRAAVAALLVVAVAGRVHESILWSRAAHDAESFVSGVVTAHPNPDRPIVVAPGILSVDSVGPFFDQANIAVALRHGYGRDDLDIRFAPTDAAFAEAEQDPAVIAVDQRPTSTLVEP